MLEVAIYEAQKEFLILLQKVAQGEEVVITNEGKPIARLVPTSPRSLEITEEEKAASRAAGERMEARAKAAPQVPFIWEEVKADLGRRY